MANRSTELTPIKARQSSPRRINVRLLLGSLTLALVAGIVLYSTSVPAPNAGTALQQPGDIR